MPISLLIVDDHRVFGQGLKAVFDAEPDFEPMSLSYPGQLIDVVTARRPDVVIMDVRLGDVSGIDLTRQLTALPAPPVIVVLSAYSDAATALAAFQAGAMAFVGKDASVEQLISAMRAALLGASWLPAELLGRLLADYPGPAEAPQQKLIQQLTVREREVLSLMVSGLDRNGIAGRLRQSPNTVRTHIRNVTVKLGCHSALEAVAVALRAGMRPE
jgi:DNA-binding NarL/FixJ family response regulator